MQTDNIMPPAGNPTECTVNVYGCEMPEDMAAIIQLFTDNDGCGLYVRIRQADESPLAGLDLTIEQAERLKSALEWALVNAHARRVKAYAESLEVKL